jgi:hypothetical protein
MPNECLDHLPIVNERHLEGVLRTYVSHDNRRRPHQGISDFPRFDERRPRREQDQGSITDHQGDDEATAGSSQ